MPGAARAAAAPARALLAALVLERAASLSGNGSAAESGDGVLYEKPPTSRGCDSDEPICMAEFRSRMLAAYGSSMQAFAAMRGGEDHDSATVAAEGSIAPGQTEFLEMVERFNPSLTHKQADYAFRGLDMDGDGHLPSYEFFEVIDSGNFFPNDWMVEAVTREAMSKEPAEAAAAPPERDLRRQAASSAGPPSVGGVWLVLAAVLGAGMAVGALFCWAGLRAVSQGHEDEEDLVAGCPRPPPLARTRASIAPPNGRAEEVSPSSRLKQMAIDDAEADEFRPKNLMTLFSCCGSNPSGWRPTSPMPPPPRGGGFV